MRNFVVSFPELFLVVVVFFVFFSFYDVDESDEEEEEEEEEEGEDANISPPALQRRRPRRRLWVRNNTRLSLCESVNRKAFLFLAALY